MQIVCENLVKSYQVAKRRTGVAGAAFDLVRRRNDQVHALDGASFSVRAGELVGYIGPNGAGKSTTVKLLSGILVPDRGRCEVLGRVPWLNRIEHVRNIGVVFGQRTQLWWDLPVTDSFDLLRRIYQIPKESCRRRLDELIAILGIEAVLQTPVRQLSLGQRMRCDLAASLLHSPPILFLDEPTIGLDAVAKIAVREVLKRLNQEDGVTVMLTTHDMDDIEAVCQRLMVVGRGRVLFDGALTDLRRTIGLERHLRVDLEDIAQEVDASAFDARLVNRQGGMLTLAFDPAKTQAAAIISRLTVRHGVKDLFVESPAIEAVIAKLYQDLKL